MDIESTDLYGRWLGMRRRINNPLAKQYHDYGGRGIRICDEWKSDFGKFYNWAINNGYKRELVLDRIDNDGNYEPSNCRFIDHHESQLNRRSNVKIYGAYWHKKHKKYIIAVTKDDKLIHGGYACSLSDAKLKRNALFSKLGIVIPND